MSLAIEAVSSSTNMGLEENNEGEKSKFEENGVDEQESMKRVGSESSFCETEDEEEDAEDKKIELGPQCTLKEQIEKDKDDESLRKWKEQLLGNVDINDVGESLEPEVKILVLSILSPGRSEIVLPIPEDGKPKGPWFTLKEGCRYSLRFSFQVSDNIVAGLKYTNNVWKTGVKGQELRILSGKSNDEDGESFPVSESHDSYPWIARNGCLVLLVLSKKHTLMTCLKRPPLLDILQEALTLLKQSLLMMTTNVTWRSTIRLTSGKIGQAFKRRRIFGLKSLYYSFES